MKITVDYPKYETDDVKQAVISSLTPSAYSYEGHLEGLAERLNKHQEFIAKLTSILVERKLLNANELKSLLGYGYEVEE